MRFKKAAAAVKAAPAKRRNSWGETVCNCTMCQRDGLGSPMIGSDTSTRTPAPVEAVEKRFTMSQARKAFTDYFGNIKKHIDFENLRDYGGGEYIVRAKTFDEVVGMTHLGSGMYANVYALSDTKVLKVIKSEDTGYARFVKVCQENKNNPYLPRILYSGVWAGKTVYVLERLSLDHPNANDTYKVKDQFAEALRHRSRNPFITFADDNLKVIAEILQDSRMTNDLHHGNIMFRGEIPVVTDPCC